MTIARVRGYARGVKTTGTCPKCQKRKVFVIRPVQQTFCDAQGTLRTFDLATAEVRTGTRTIFGEQTKTEGSGPVDALVCATCGYVEWYAPSSTLAKLARLAERSSVVTLIDGERGDAPYR